MSSSREHENEINEEEDGVFAMQLATTSVLPMVMRTAIELDLLEIMAKAGEGAQLSAAEIASHLPAKNPDAPTIIDRMLRLLASHSVLTCSLVTGKDGNVQRLYGLGPVCKYFVKDEDGISLAQYLVSFQSKSNIDCWYHFKDVILEGGVSPFHKQHGKGVFEFANVNVFNEAMYNHTTIVMKKVLEKYKGFEGLNVVVDVGGGFGANLRLVVSKYPQIKAINFDLPHVVKSAPALPGVEHVGGDMFRSIPEGEAVFMKWILHDWDDGRCLKLLKNCYEALPECGRVIVVESIAPELPGTDPVSRNTFKLDMCMFNSNPGGKERTAKEFEILAKGAGFAAMKIVCPVYSYSVIELHKSA